MHCEVSSKAWQDPELTARASVQNTYKVKQKDEHIGACL
jgi:hypothetical protein